MGMSIVLLTNPFKVGLARNDNFKICDFVLDLVKTLHKAIDTKNLCVQSNTDGAFTVWISPTPTEKKESKLGSNSA